jgi:N-glycosylase/DNA lyase
MSVDDCNESLIHIKGVGAKVANCVSLFGLGHREAFPVDVWIKRIVEQLYFDGHEMPVEKIGQFGCSRFGEYGGYAQQYLFYYGKTIKAGKNQQSK